MNFISTTVSPTTTFWKAIWQLGCQIRLRIFNIFRQVMGFGQKQEWVTDHPASLCSGIFHHRDSWASTIWTKLLSSGNCCSLLLGNLLGSRYPWELSCYTIFARGKQLWADSDAQTWDFEKLNFFLPRQVLIKAIPNSYFMSQSGAVQPYPTHPACNCPILWVLMVISTSPI